MFFNAHYLSKKSQCGRFTLNRVLNNHGLFSFQLSSKISDNLHEAITDCICNAIYTSGVR